jgi:nicotinamide-nucleotide amidase
MILAEIITIGDEILIGQIVDTNSAWMAQQLNLHGIKVKQITSVSDNEQHILTALDEAKSRADIILITGGLGPTKDDITKHTLCKYFNTTLRFDEEVFRNVEELFRKRGRTLITETNRKQAEVPVNCTVLYNTVGTAPGMWFEESRKPEDGSGTKKPIQHSSISHLLSPIFVIVSMPGVPYEMKKMMLDVIPRLKAKFKTPVIIHKTILLQGIGESFLSDMIASWEDALPSNMKLAYLPQSSLLRLRISATGDDESRLRNEVEDEAKKLHALAGEYIFGYEDDTLEKLIGDLLRKNKKTLSTAESFTGGNIAHKITSVPGSSDYFIGSVVAYDNRIKTEVLGVGEETLKKHGAVSEETVREMALGIQKKFKTDYSIATTGVAGPSGGSEEKPVGTAWIGIATPDKVIAKKFQLGSDRGRIVIEATLHGLNMLRKNLTS